MADLTNPHDRFFKDLLSRPEAAASFLENYLPAEIVAALDLNQFELSKDSFLDEELRQHLSDLLYRVQLKSGGEALVYILFEHKSAPDPWVAFQLLRYEIRIWECEKRNGAEKMPPIFPLVFYHGLESWKVSTSFSSLFAAEDLMSFGKYLPNFEHHLCDLSKFRAEDLKGAAILRVGLSLLQHIFSEQLPERLPEIFKLLLLADEQTALEYLVTVLRYLSAAAHPPVMTEVKEALDIVFQDPQGETMRKPFYETLLEEGVEIGQQMGAAAVMLRQIHRRFGILEAETVDHIRTLPLESLERLGEDLLDFTSREDLLTWLARNPPAPPRSENS